MPSSNSSFLNPRSQFSGLVSLWMAIIIFGAASAITRKLTAIGSQHLIHGHNPISFCNALLVGNLCALGVLIMLYGRQWSVAALKQISRQQWFGLISVALLAGALAPALFFQALAMAPVNTVVLVGRLEPPLTLALSVWWLREQINPGEVLGAIVAFVGVVLTVYLQPATTLMSVGGVQFDAGAGLAALGSAATALATIMGKKWLNHIPLGIYSITRTGLGTIVFYAIALLLYGRYHFIEVFSPFLWEWMLLYGLIIVVCGESFWLRGVQSLPASQVSVIASFTPAIGIVAAYLILGEVPNLAQYIGGGVILLGIAIGSRGGRQKRQRSSDDLTTMQMQEMENQAGFRGI